MTHQETSQAPIHDGISLLHTPNLPLGCSVNHWFSFSLGRPQDFKPRSSLGGWEEGFTYTALELQKAKFAPARCKPALLLPHPSISEHQYRSQQPDPAGKGTAGLNIPPLNHKQQKRSSFVTAQGGATWPLPTGGCQLLAGENSAPRSEVAGSRATLRSRAGGDGARQGTAAVRQRGSPVPSPNLGSHTRTAGGGKMPISSRRDSTGCSQRCS